MTRYLIRSQWINYRSGVHIYLYIILDQRRLDIIDQVECGLHNRLHIYPLGVILYFPWHCHQIEGTNGF